MDAATSSISHVHGPIFISYRHSDGSELATSVAKVLRAHGLSVWLDQYDMLAGSFKYRMNEALTAGPSGGVLIATPEVEASSPIRGIEYPGLVGLSESGKIRGLSVVTNMVDEDGMPDKERTASLYPDLSDTYPTFKLAGMTHYRGDDAAGLDLLANHLVTDRLQGLLGETRGQNLRVSLATDSLPSSRDVSGGHLDVRLPEGDRELPSSEGIRLLARSARTLTRAWQDSQANVLELDVRVARLSVALAFGALFPRARAQRVHALRGEEVWASDAGACTQSEVPRVVGRPIPDALINETSEEVLAVVNVLPLELGMAPVHALSQRPEGWRAAVIIERPNAGTLVPANDAGVWANDVAWALYQSLHRAGTHRLHLVFAGPTQLAVLVGRHLNGYAVTAYETQGHHNRAGRCLPTVTFEIGDTVTRIEAVEDPLSIE